MRKLTLTCFTLAVLLVMGTAFASDTIDWGVLGPAYTVLTTPQRWGSYYLQEGFVGVRNGNDFERRDQGNGWSGNFFPGEHLIWNQGGFGQTGIDIGVLFDVPVYGGGSQIQADYLGPFTATLTAYDIGGFVIGTTVMLGNSTSAGDGSAIFISFTSASRNVSFLDFNVVDQYGGDSLAIGTVTFYDTPEPSSLLLLGSGALGLAGVIRRKLRF